MEILDNTSINNLDKLRALKGKPVYYAFSKSFLTKAVHLRNAKYIGVLESVMTWPSTTSVFHIKDHVNPRPYIVEVVDDGEYFYKPFSSPEDNSFLAGKTIVHKITGEEIDIKYAKDRCSIFFDKEGFPDIVSSATLLAEYTFKDGSPCGYPVKYSELSSLQTNQALIL